MVMPVHEDRVPAAGGNAPSQARPAAADALQRLPDSTNNLGILATNGHRSATPSPTFPIPSLPTPTMPPQQYLNSGDSVGSTGLPGNGEYGFLLGGLIDDQALAHASLLALSSGTEPHEELINQGCISAIDYAYAVANALGLAIWQDSTDAGAQVQALSTINSKAGRLIALRFARGGTTFLVIDAAGQSPGGLARLAEDNAVIADQALIGTRNALLALLERNRRATLLTTAINGLRRTRPDLSAGNRIWLWQALSISIVIGLAIGALAIAPGPSISVLTGLTVIPFFCVVILRCMALGEILPRNRSRESARPKQRNNTDLPIYTILVPLFRETPVLPQLLRAMAALDYPPVKLQILLVLEAADAETIAAVSATKLAANVDVIVVPDAHPRTKPKAVNYALQFARGTYTVIYDAEDIPEPDQLRMAVAAFDHGSPHLACLQARLNLYNPYAGWFARQFTIEYSALFDALLPALQRLALPIPLGGTSNHFRGIR